MSHNLRKRTKESKTFEKYLDFPFCPEGHLFYVPNHQSIVSQVFNPEQSEKNLNEEIDGLIIVVASFKEERANISQISIIYELHIGATTQLQTNLQITEKLLQRLGY